LVSLFCPLNDPPKIKKPCVYRTFPLLLVAGTAPISNHFITGFIAIIDFAEFLNSKHVLNNAFDEVKAN
jgi:hypothetical protein